MPKPAPCFDASNLDALLDSVRRNGRPAKFPKPEPKFFTDAERFRWWFRYRAKTLFETRGFAHLPTDEKLQDIRNWMDEQMAAHPEQVHL